MNIGIDLGTTNSLVAYMDLTGPKIIPGPDGDRLVPSVVSVNPSGEIVVGNPARELLITQPERTVYSAKRLMGRGLEDIQEELKLFPFQVASGSGSVWKTSIAAPAISPISSAAIRASSSTIPPRARLTKKADFFMAANSRTPISR